MTDPAPLVRAKLSYKALFCGFFWAGIMGFGGVLPILRHAMVDERGWLTQVEFNELFSLCQSLPGANVVNFSFAFGARERGVRGAVATVMGLLTAPVAIVLALAIIYAHYSHFAPLRHALLGMAAAAAGLALGSSVRMATPTLTSLRNICLAVVVYGMAIVLHIPLWLIILVTLPVSLFLSWRALP